MEPKYTPIPLPDICPQCKKPTNPALPFCSTCCFDLMYGSVKKKHFGNCCYCGKIGQLSQEHVLPDWIGNEFPRRYKNTFHTLTRPTELTHFKEIEYKANTEKLQGDPLTQKVLNVCQKCNNGWMSTLQVAAKPFVRQLASGSYRVLSRDDMFILARWCAMTAINIEHLGRIEISKPHQRSSIMTGNEMPGGYHISVGLIDDPRHSGFHHFRPIQLPIILSEIDGNRVFADMQSTFFIIEHAVFHVVSAQNEMLLSMGYYDYPINRHYGLLSEIWPVPNVFNTTRGHKITMELIKYMQMG